MAKTDENAITVSGPRRITVGPFNRVEGDLEVKLEVSGGQVAAAYVHASLYRGFENMLIGRDPYDALVMVPRICGICSVSQSAAAVAALANLSGGVMPANGRHASNLVLASEVVADHLTHFYLFFMPDLARSEYATRPWHADIAERFTALKGSAAQDMLPARAGLLRVLAMLAGKWPHTLALRPGGTTRVLHAGERSRLQLFLREFRSFAERHMFGDRLENISALSSAAALQTWAKGRVADFPRFLACATDLGLDALGKGSDRFLSSGAYPDALGEESFLFSPGVLDLASGAVSGFDAQQITEDHGRSWLKNTAKPVSPAAGLTQPDADKRDAYSWCKAPRYAGAVFETGALARQLLAGHPLLADMVAKHSGRVLSRMVARQIEIATLIPAMERWAGAIADDAPFFEEPDAPVDGAATGFVEAARGTLGHWLTVSSGKIARYQIVAPTTWNFSPRDSAGDPGALELALQGLPVADGEAAPLTVQHVVRSFDPCMVCTVH